MADRGRSQVRIPATLFEQWAASVFPDGTERYSFSAIARLSGVKRSTLYYQRKTGYIDPRVVLSVSRSLGLSPVEELASFDAFRSLSILKEPTTAEVLSQVTIPDLLNEMLSRYHQVPPAYPQEPQRKLNPFRRWMAKYDLRGRYTELAHAIGIRSQTEFSAKITHGRFTIGQVVELAAHADLNCRFGLYVMGAVSLSEAGYPDDLREQIVNSAPTAAIAAEVLAYFPELTTKTEESCGR